MASGASFCAACGAHTSAEAAATASGSQPSNSAGGVTRGQGDLPAVDVAPDLYAGFWRRVAAYLLDSLLLMVIGFVAGVLLGLLEFAVAHAASRASGYVVGVVVAWLYFALFESSRQQATPGKLALGLRVTDARGARIGFGRASGRYFGKYVSALILFVGFMMAGWTRRKQALHDMMAGCCVVRRDGLERIERGEAIAVGARVPGMPGWAIALIVVVGSLFLLVPILAAISIPAYENYLVRAQVDEGRALAAGAETAISEYYSKTGNFPEKNGDVGLSPPSAITGKYVSGVQVGVLNGGQGVVLVTFSSREPQHANAALDGKHLLFVAHPAGDVIEWECRSDAPDRYLPSPCRQAVDP